MDDFKSLLENLDTICRKYNDYDYGIPYWDEESLLEMKLVIENWAVKETFKSLREYLKILEKEEYIEWYNSPADHAQREIINFIYYLRKKRIMVERGIG